MSLRFAGYAALFDRPDRGGDIVKPGAFAGVPQAVPLLREHSGPQIGAIERIESDARGLRVIGRIVDAGAAGALAAGTLTGLSFGYRAIGVQHRRYRELTRVALIEISLVARPMQPLARVHAVAPG